jgi:hypothetical protein
MNTIVFISFFSASLRSGIFFHKPKLRFGLKKTTSTLTGNMIPFRIGHLIGFAFLDETKL